MLGSLVQLAISWALIYAIYRRHFDALGLVPTLNRVAQLLAGLILAGAIAALWQWMTIAFIENSWVFNSKLTFAGLATGAKGVFASVLFEELLFRGALLYIAINKLGTVKACLLSAVCFGVYHWFSYGLFGNPWMMAIVFLMTGFVGYAWAVSFARTQSMYLPTGLHLGWNLVSMLVFGNGKMWTSVLVKLNQAEAQGFTSLAVFLFQVLAVPTILLGYFYWKKMQTGGPNKVAIVERIA